MIEIKKQENGKWKVECDCGLLEYETEQEPQGCIRCRYCGSKSCGE